MLHTRPPTFDVRIPSTRVSHTFSLLQARSGRGNKREGRSLRGASRLRSPLGPQAQLPARGRVRAKKLKPYSKNKRATHVNTETHIHAEPTPHATSSPVTTLCLLPLRARRTPLPTAVRHARAERFPSHTWRPCRFQASPRPQKQSSTHKVEAALAHREGGGGVHLWLPPPRRWDPAAS
jgi:hypothetical protein